MNRLTSDTNSTLGDWSVANAGNEPGMVALLQPVSITGMFKDFNANGAAPSAWRGDADQLALWGGSQYGATTRYNPQYSADNQVEEKTRAAYVQLELQGDIAGMTTNTRLGLRYERTDVESVSQVATPTGLLWQSNNDFQLVRSAELQPFSEKTSYNYILPNLDFSIDIPTS